MSKCHPVHQRMSTYKQKFLILGHKNTGKSQAALRLKLTMKLYLELILLPTLTSKESIAIKGRATFASVGALGTMWIGSHKIYQN